MKYLFLLLPFFGYSQKSQSVTVKATTDILKVAAKSGQSLKIQVNGKLIYQQGVQIIEPAKVLLLSDFTDWQTALHTAIIQGLPLQGEQLTINTFDKYQWDGNFVLQGTIEKPLNIYVDFPELSLDTWAMYLGTGKHVFKYVNFICRVQAPIHWGSMFAAAQGFSQFDNQFINCNFIGDWRYNYCSTQGLGYVSFVNSNLYAWFENIQLYSQSGSKTLVMKDCTIKADSSHCIYSHPNNNYYIENVTCLGSGKLAFDSRWTKPLEFTSTYQIFINCKNSKDAWARIYNTPPMWHFWGQGTPNIIVDKCNVPMYTWQGNFTVTNSNLSNGGNGTTIYGKSTLDNCTGEITAADKMVITNSRLQVIGTEFADIEANNSTISFYNKFKPSTFKATFTKCSIGEFDLSATNFKVLFENCNFRNQYGYIRLFGNVSQMDDIIFIGNSYPVATF